MKSRWRSAARTAPTWWRASRDATIPTRRARTAEPRSRSGEDLPKPAEHEFYQADLIGLEVVNREGVRLGRVAGFFDGGAHEVMRVDHEGGQRLLPVAGEVIRRVDLDAGTVEVDWGADW